MASYPAIVSAVDAAVIASKKKLFDDLKAFIVGELDEDSVEAIKELFDRFEKDNSLDAVPEAPKPTKGTKKSKKNDDKPEKAKRAPSDYNKFVGEKMKEIRAANPELKAKEAMQQAMALWKEHKATLATVAVEPAKEE